ncbi:dual specificity calcium/calmodulin-dependent 3',5'-cyclic nucleotide phosphodiesterase 1-like isoform X3 [Lutzomyia longipalpis]|uniref:dual specificity calcium/calmodulin-dependent 3',5'-cyclic nucleotide phosphodiesterase 1-like isoform X3 n=1 Tax=Lutzomyia longipalpis TaxID=7200 RepID=UPI00248383F5|nr:dual specificity calcium/calmodulin-dependent 3',5'-cyclic nucleotide phosphodiesterase 1-like isoform X3 [Lutzomyia longipalpis]
MCDPESANDSVDESATREDDRDQGRTSKDLVHKCNSDPGGERTSGSSSQFGSVLSRSLRHHTGTVTRKCVLTLDGYSYVIVASSPEGRAACKEDSVVIREKLSSLGEARTSAQSGVTRDTHMQGSSPENGQLAKDAALTIVRRSSSKKGNIGGNQTINLRENPQESFEGSEGGGRGGGESDDNTNECDVVERMQSVTLTSSGDELDNVDLATDNLPAVDTPDACDKAAMRLRSLLRQLQRGEISAEILQKNLHYAARVLEAVFIDETNIDRSRERNEPGAPRDGAKTAPQIHGRGTTVQRRRLRTPVWARRLADEDDELSEVQPDAVPQEVRAWLQSTFTRQLATTRRKADEKPKFRSVAHAIRAGIFVDRIYRRVSNSALMQFPPEVVKVLKTLDDWSFDVFALAEAGNSQPVKYLGYDLLNRYGMIHKFKVPPALLEVFLNRIEEGYCRFRNPYHNNLHAADVAQTVHHVLCQTGLMHWLTDLEIFATLLAALIHDYEHTGTTNNFHVKSGSDTALLYNDRAVLENHHLSAAFRVLKEDECNVLQNLTRDEFRELRSLVIDMVLATDMSFHFQQIKNMRNLLTLGDPQVDKSKALAMVLHCCDISHPAKKWNIHHRWTMLLLEEFFRQGDLERELGLDFSPLCDRKTTLVAESQIGFIEFIVEPSMAVCADMLEIVLAPIAPPLQCKSTPSTASQDESSESGRSLSMAEPTIHEDAEPPKSYSDDKRSRFIIKKPWIACLAENKKIWKEQAIRDAEARAASEAEQGEDEGDPPATTKD